MIVERVVWTNSTDFEYTVVGTDTVCSSVPDPCPLGVLTSISSSMLWIRCGFRVTYFCPLANNGWYRAWYLSSLAASGEFVGSNRYSGPVPIPTMAEAGSLLELTYVPDFTATDSQVLRLYWAFFQREGDLSGSKYWLDIARSGVSLDDIAYNFSVSAEFQVRYGNTTNRRFLEIVYQNVLGRDYDQDGFDYWLDLLERGQLNRGGVVRWVAASSEFEQQHPYPDAVARDAQSDLFQDPAYPCVWST